MARSSDKPIWLTNDVIAIMKAQDDCLKIYVKAKTEENKANMRRARNLTNVSVKLARADYIKEQLDIFNNDPKKKIWKMISEIIQTQIFLIYVMIITQSFHQKTLQTSIVSSLT